MSSTVEAVRHRATARWSALLLLAVVAVLFVWRGGVMAERTGGEIRLRTAAYEALEPGTEPYLRLSYMVEGRPDFELSGLAEGDELWITVERDAPVWRKLRIDVEPVQSSEDQLSLRAEWRGHRAVLTTAGRLSMPAELCREAESLLRYAPREGIVTLRVDAAGNPTPVSMELSGRLFESAL